MAARVERIEHRGAVGAVRLARLTAQIQRAGGVEPSGRTEIACRPGDFVLAPRGIPHAYRVGERPARWLVMSSPAGFERFVVAVAALDKRDPVTLTALAAEHDIEISALPACFRSSLAIACDASGYRAARGRFVALDDEDRLAGAGVSCPARASLSVRG